MSKDSRAGGKFTGSHTTLIPLAREVCDIAHAVSAVSKISPGFITAGLRPIRGLRRIKIVEREGALQLTIRDNTSLQEVYIYTSDFEGTKKSIARSLVDRSIQISG